ncbi:translation initiation factor eIF2B subunit delta isoform X2 [Macrobrachium rosenbergii]|uniref:translation initiation factor eIF2B subunit delta isoform X2 n=1 Tax=Macrobrachium rosenbergii TaxID=79674 RepID=UPI0034D4A311
MAPPDRSRRRRHGKSPRNKRFGSGKSTPSSPAGTPTRLPHSQKASELAGGTSKDTILESQVGASSSDNLPSGVNSVCLSASLEGICSENSLASEKENSVPLKDIDEEGNDLKGDIENFTMSKGMNKLDRLCGLLEHIVIEHKDTVSQNVAKANSPNNEKVKSNQSNDIAHANNVTSNSNEEKTREEVELERKARKEAKKAKKKGGNKENEKEGAEVNNASKMEVNHETPKNAQAVQKPSSSGGGQQGTPTKLVQEAKNKDADSSGKSKADLKRERREKQEAQRKAKMEAKAQETEKKQKQPQQGSKDKTLPQPPKKKSDVEVKRGRDKKSADKEHSERRVPLLGHLTPFLSQPPSHPVNCDFIHPAIRTLGIKMKERVIDGSTARVVSMLAAFKRVINDYQTPEACDLHRDLAEKLVSNMAFLRSCRPQNIAMDNAVRFLKHEVNSIGPSVPEAQAKDELRSSIDEYIRENIILASSTIASHAAQVIKDGDVILTFGYSALVSDVVEAALSRGEKVSVVIADTPHPPSGAAMAKRLADLGVTTHYRLITEVSHIMNKVTKVIVEAESVMMNGAVQGLCGTAGLALAAAIHDTPFIVLCHTYKFCNNDLTDSLVLNELGDADSVVSCNGEFYNLLSDWRSTPNLNVVSLVYDITPANLVTALITEQNVLPTSAVPVIIRRNYADILGQD